MMWRAVYSDGTALSQFDSDGSEHKYTEIDRSKTCMIQLVENCEPVFSMPLKEGQCFFIRQRVTIDLHAREKQRVWIVGWRQKKLLRTDMKVNFVYSDGKVETLDEFQPDHRLYRPINFLPFEVP